MNISTFGQKFQAETGILRLMADFDEATQQEGMIMLGGGNPSHIPAVQNAFRNRMLRILDSESDFENLIGNYAGPGGELPFIHALASLFKEVYGWEVGPEHIALTNGSQTAFFLLFNLFAGHFPDGTTRRILLPMAPEYIGYEDVGIHSDIFVSYKPRIERLNGRFFKYRVDFNALTVTPDIGAICVSRPTNPTGNVLTETEINTLSNLAQQHHIPLIIDNAYGMPFPGIIFTDAQPTWEPHIIMCLSLSKLGLPGARTGIIVADPQIIKLITSMNAVISLAPGSFGSALALEAITSREIIHLSHNVIRPHYQQMAQQAVDWLCHYLEGINFRIHTPEGAIFLWIWFEDCPVSSQTLYEQLKANGLIVVPGHFFFPGLAEPWPHKQECIRMNYASHPEKVHQGIKILASVLKKLYKISD